MYSVVKTVRSGNRSSSLPNLFGEKKEQEKPFQRHTVSSSQKSRNPSSKRNGSIDPRSSLPTGFNEVRQDEPELTYPNRKGISKMFQMVNFPRNLGPCYANCYRITDLIREFEANALYLKHVISCIKKGSQPDTDITEKYYDDYFLIIRFLNLLYPLFEEDTCMLPPYGDIYFKCWNEVIVNIGLIIKNLLFYKEYRYRRTQYFHSLIILLDTLCRMIKNWSKIKEIAIYVYCILKLHISLKKHEAVSFMRIKMPVEKSKLHLDRDWAKEWATHNAHIGQMDFILDMCDQYLEKSRELINKISMCIPFLLSKDTTLENQVLKEQMYELCKLLSLPNAQFI